MPTLLNNLSNWHIVNIDYPIFIGELPDNRQISLRALAVDWTQSILLTHKGFYSLKTPDKVWVKTIDFGNKIKQVTQFWYPYDSL